MSQQKRILLLDTGNEWGGGTNSMLELLKRLDRQRFAVTCCFYKDYRKGRDGRLLSEELAEIGIPLRLLPTRKQPLWAKLAKEVARRHFVVVGPTQEAGCAGHRNAVADQATRRRVAHAARRGRFRSALHEQPAIL